MTRWPSLSWGTVAIALGFAGCMATGPADIEVTVHNETAMPFPLELLIESGGQVEWSAQFNGTPGSHLLADKVHLAYGEHQFTARPANGTPHGPAPLVESNHMSSNDFRWVTTIQHFARTNETRIDFSFVHGD